MEHTIEMDVISSAVLILRHNVLMQALLRNWGSQVVLLCNIWIANSTTLTKKMS